VSPLVVAAPLDVAPLVCPAEVDDGAVDAVEAVEAVDPPTTVVVVVTVVVCPAAVVVITVVDVVEFQPVGTGWIKSHVTLH